MKKLFLSLFVFLAVSKCYANPGDRFACPSEIFCGEIGSGHECVYLGKMDKFRVMPPEDRSLNIQPNDYLIPGEYKLQLVEGMIEKKTKNPPGKAFCVYRNSNMEYVYIWLASEAEAYADKSVPNQGWYNSSDNKTGCDFQFKVCQYIEK